MAIEDYKACNKSPTMDDGDRKLQGWVELKGLY